MRFIFAILITQSLGSSGKLSSMLSGGGGTGAALETDKSRPATPPGHCVPPVDPPSGLLKKSEPVNDMPPIPKENPLWEENRGLVKGIWNENVRKVGDTLPPPPGGLLASGFSSSVWVVELPLGPARKRIVKFETNCAAVKRNNEARFRTAFANEQTLLMEFIVSELVCKQEPPGICPEIFSISEAAKVDDTKIMADLKLTMPKLDRPACVGISTYRRIEEAFVGPSVSSLFEDVSPVDRAILAIQVLLKTIDLLQALHGRGFIHGDIHKDNIALRNPNERIIPPGVVPDLTLIDFGLAKFFPIEIGTPECVGEDAKLGLSLTLLSKFQLAGYRTSRRDDVYRAFEVFLNLISDGKYFDLMGIYGLQAERVKFNFDIGSFFRELKDAESSETRGTGFWKRLSMGDVGQVIGIWKSIYTYVASGLEIDEQPDYDWIKDEMSRSLEIVNKYKEVAFAGRGVGTSVAAEAATEQSGSEDTLEVDFDLGDDDSSETDSEHKRAASLPYMGVSAGRVVGPWVDEEAESGSSSVSSAYGEGVGEEDSLSANSPAAKKQRSAHPGGRFDASSSSEQSDESVADFLGSDDEHSVSNGSGSHSFRMRSV